jgi:polyhydroxyalkanoate synthesis regulator phasin
MSEMYDNIHESEELLNQVKKIAQEMSAISPPSPPQLPNSASQSLPQEVLKELHVVFQKKMLEEKIELLERSVSLLEQTAQLESDKRELEERIAELQHQVGELQTKDDGIPYQITCVAYVMLLIYIFKLWLFLQPYGRHIVF